MLTSCCSSGCCHPPHPFLIGQLTYPAYFLRMFSPLKSEWWSSSFQLIQLHVSCASLHWNLISYETDSGGMKDNRTHGTFSQGTWRFWQQNMSGEKQQTQLRSSGELYNKRQGTLKTIIMGARMFNQLCALAFSFLLWVISPLYCTLFWHKRNWGGFFSV